MVHHSGTAPAPVVFEASVTIDGPKGGRTVPLEEFHMRSAQDPQRETVLEPGEVVTVIETPPPRRSPPAPRTRPSQAPPAASRS